MAKLKPWYQAVYPREDLREGKPMDASEFAVHLDHVRDGKATSVYQNPVEFFQRTYLTKNLLTVSAEILRRLNGIKVETSAVYNMTTQFGGGKTHALTLFYHLAKHGQVAKNWNGVNTIMKKAEVDTVPQANVAVFVGTEFDSISGRGGDNGEPVRKTPWGEIAWQLGGQAAFDIVAKHEEQLIAPSSEVIRKFIPQDKPCMILMDELMNYVSRFRKVGLSSQLYDFLHNLSEESRRSDNTVLVVSIPASEMELANSSEDQADYDRFKKLLDRLGKAVIMSAESETAEIIRRRLFEWDGFTTDMENTINAYANWVIDNRTQLTGWFPVDSAKNAFKASYPFHPSVLSVFERKWQQLPRFQQTRGILRLLALWVSKAYQDGYRGAHQDPLISLGTAPLEDSFFRSAVFEQLGESKLEGAVTTDICGKDDSHSLVMDKEAVQSVKKSRLHRKVATSIFFESNGGMMKSEATLSEIRLAVAEPGLDIGNVETVLETLADNCYFLSIERNRYRFSISPNLNKLLSDRRANVKPKDVELKIREEIQKVFTKNASYSNIDIRFYPAKSSDITDRPIVTIAVLSPDYSMAEAAKTRSFVKEVTWECGQSKRTYKSAIIWCIADSDAAMKEDAKKLLAWQHIRDEQGDLRLDDSQKIQLEEQLHRAKRDLNETVWRSYKILMLLGTDNDLREIDLGLINSSQATTMLELVLKQLRDGGDLDKNISPNFLLRKWPGMTEWSTKGVRDAFYASPLFPRLLDASSIKDTISRGVSQGLLAYVGKGEGGHYQPFRFEEDLAPEEVEISEDMFIITAEEARKLIEPPKLTTLMLKPELLKIAPADSYKFNLTGFDQHGRSMPIEKPRWSASKGTVGDNGFYTAAQEEGNDQVRVQCGEITSSANVVIAKSGSGPGPGPEEPEPEPAAKKLQWSGYLPIQKWMNFYTKVLAKYATGTDLRVKVSFEVTLDKDTANQKEEETRIALKELGL